MKYGRVSCCVLVSGPLLLLTYFVDDYLSLRQPPAPDSKPFISGAELVEELSRPFAVWSSGNNRSSYGWCLPYESNNAGLLYIKIPKSASTTLAGVNLYIAEKLGKRLQTSCYATFNHGTSWSDELRYGDRNVSNSFLWTAVRYPTDRVISHYFFSRASRIGENVTEETIMKYVTRDMYQGFSTNYLKLDPDGPDNDPGAIRDIIQRYDFIGIKERLDETLVVLSMLLRIPLADVVSLIAKKAGGWDHTKTRLCPKLLPKWTTPLIDEYLQQGFVEHNSDVLLYQVVNASLDKTIDALGRTKVENKAKMLRSYSERAQKICEPMTVFPCPRGGPGHNKRVRQDCYHEDIGCGHRCINELLGSESEQEWEMLQASSSQYN